MPGFEAIYKQTVTLFNRVKGSGGEDDIWYPTVIKGVHLVVDKSSAWNSNGGSKTDNTRLHIRYQSGQNGAVMIAGKTWYEPKAYRRIAQPESTITFSFGNHEDFDFFMEGVFDEFSGAISDSNFGKHGFYNYMNTKYDNVFAITSVAKYNLIPHFEIMAR